MLSSEDAKPQSNNRTKSDLGHVGRRFVGAWVSGYVWYFELSREPEARSATNEAPKSIFQ